MPHDLKFMETAYSLYTFCVVLGLDDCRNDRNLLPLVE